MTYMPIDALNVRFADTIWLLRIGVVFPVPIEDSFFKATTPIQYALTTFFKADHILTALG